MDGPVVGEESIGDRAQPESGLLVVDRDRLVGAVAARQHEWPVHLVTEQVVERGIGQHHAEPRRSCCDRWGDSGAGAAPDEHDRARDAVEERDLGGGRLGERVRCGGHHRQGLLLTVLPRAQAGDGLLVGRVAGEVVAAEALDGQDPPLEQQSGGLLDRHRQPWPALVAGDRLGVEAAVSGILVFAATGGTEREAGHRRAASVVGDGRHDREAGAAIRAVDERVAVASIGRVEELLQAVVARGGVRRDERRPSGPSVFAEHDREPGIEVGRAPGRLDRPATCARGGASVAIASTNAASVPGSPSISTTTPSASLSTNPESP